jgi:hypothetical protein
VHVQFSSINHGRERLKNLLDELLWHLCDRVLRLEFLLVYFHFCDLVLVVIPHNLSGELDTLEKQEAFFIFNFVHLILVLFLKRYKVFKSPDNYFRVR